MAPTGESIYFPPLDKLLSGEAHLISWKDIFTALSDPHGIEGNGTLDPFLADQFVAELLSKPFDVDKSASHTSKTNFETKTAAINVTPAAHGQYDIKQIKEDALWLSRETKTDEVAALRIVMLEWQSRPAVQLLHGFSEEETVSIQNASGVENLRSSVGGARVSSLLAVVGTHQPPSSEFLTTENRQSRFLDIYLSERLHILKANQLLLSATLRGLLSAREQPQYVGGSANNRSGSTIGVNTIEETPRSVRDAQRRLIDAEPKEGPVNLVHYIDAFENRVERLDVGSGWFADEGGRPDAEDAWATNMIEEMTHIMQTMFLLLYFSTNITSSKVVLMWFQLMVRYGFFETFNPSSERQRAVLMPFQSSIAIISLAMLKLPSSISYLVDYSAQPEFDDAHRPFFADVEDIANINNLFLEAAGACIIAASPAVFAWVMILQTLRMEASKDQEHRERQSLVALDEVAASSEDSLFRERSQSSTSRVGSIVSLPSSLFEELYDAIRPSQDEDPVSYMAKCAVDECHVFDAISIISENITTLGDPETIDQSYAWVRIMFLDLMQNALDFLGYIPELVSATLSILTLSETLGRTRSPKNEHPVADARAIFIKDPEFIGRFFRVAQARFPYEALPFLKLCRSLAGSTVVDEDGTLFIASVLQSMTTYTQKTPHGFNAYHTIREEENANFVSLNQALDMFSDNTPRVLSITGPNGGHEAAAPYCIPSGTVGQVISDSKPVVVIWSYQYSGIAYLGKWLEMFLTSQTIEIAESQDEIVIEIIGLFVELLTSSLVSSKERGDNNDVSDAQRLLETASDDIDRNGDIISVVLSILEQALQKASNSTSHERHLDLVLVCLQFAQTTVDILPGRVWPFLARGSLLGIDGRGGMLGAILSSAEVPSGTFDFLIGCSRLYGALIEDAVANAIKRQTFVETRNRLSTSQISYSATPIHVITKVLYAFGQTLVGVYESSANWRFNDESQRLEINKLLASIFDNILYYAYGVGESSDLNSKPTSVLSTFAPYLLDYFLARSRDITFNPLLRVLFDGVATPQSTFYLKYHKLWVSQVGATLRLSNTLVRAGRLQDLPSSPLEIQLFKSSPVLVRLYASDTTYKGLVVTLLESLIKDATNSVGAPPSLLGNLGTTTARNFGDCLSKFDRPVQDRKLGIRIWNLLSALVGNRQQWFAIVLLTGSSPRSALKQTGSSGEESMRGKPFLTIAIDGLANIGALEPSMAIAMLEFIALAQEHWPWAVAGFIQHPRFLPGLLDYMSRLEYDSESILDNCYSARIASLVCDIIAVYLHHSRQSGEDFAVRYHDKILENLPGLVAKGYATGYNISLHKNLEKNIEAKYPGFKVLSLKRTPLHRSGFGTDFFYDNDMAGKLLGYDRAWKGPPNCERGFKHEFTRANLNLSKFQAQVQLLHGWKFLAGELCDHLGHDAAFQEMTVDVVINCLDANLRTESAEAVFARLMQTRADFALEILQRLAKLVLQIRPAQKQSMLSKTMEAIRAAGGSFAAAITNNNLDYYRSLMKVLFLALQLLPKTHPDIPSDDPKHSDTLNTVQEILDVVVAQGFRALTSYLHEEPSQGFPSDFEILGAILRSCLQVKDMGRIYEAVVGRFREHGATRSAITLFSYADKLTINGDPIYGELSIRFLLELSRIPTMAEELAVEGLLSNLSSSALTHYFRRSNGSGPFDNPYRMFNIWASGFLPLCLNLLDSVGRSLASEISSFLNQFPSQLERAASAFATTYASPAVVQRRAAGSNKGSITLRMASEANSLALISFILESYRIAGASAGVDPLEIARLKWDGKQVKEDIEEMLGNMGGLRARLVAMDEKEVEMMQMEPEQKGTGLRNRLEERVVKELRGAMMCLGAEQE